MATYFANDTFTDLNGIHLDAHTPDTGGPWSGNLDSIHGGSAWIEDNRLSQRPQLPDSSAFYGLLSATPPSADYIVSADVVVYSNILFNSLGILGRMQNTTPTANPTYYEAVYNGALTRWELRKMVSGAQGLLGTYVQVLTVAQSYRMALVMSGTGISVTVNGSTVITATDADITLAGHCGVLSPNARPQFAGPAGYLIDNFAAGDSGLAPAPPAPSVSVCGLIHPEFVVLTDNLFLGRWQTTAARDMMIGQDLTTGDALPDWVYSTGFAPTPFPAVVNGLLLDSDGQVKVTTAKTVAGVEPMQSRSFDAIPVPDQDEVWIPGAADFRGQKLRVELSAPNGTTVRRAMWDRGGLEGAKGG